jgi:hypothetical protein
MEAIKNRKLVEVAKEEARKILEEDPKLKQVVHQALKTKLEEFSFHDE